MNGTGTRAALRIAVGALISAGTSVVVASTDVPDQVVAAWSGFAVAIWGASEAAYDAFAARRKK